VAVAAAAADQQSLSTAGAAAAAAQQPATDYLPSLVIFGRCCLQWAEQLQQQAPKLLLLSSGALKQQEQQRREAELHAHSAALVCVPGLRSGAATQPGDLLESMAGTVSEWVGGIEAPAALAQLQAADCAPQQLQQQLQGLLSAAHDARDPAGAERCFTHRTGAAAADNWGQVLQHRSATLLQQPGMWQHQRPHRGAVGVGAQLHLCGLPHSPLLWAELSAARMEAAQACVQGASSGGCNHRNSRQIVTGSFMANLGGMSAPVCSREPWCQREGAVLVILYLWSRPRFQEPLVTHRRTLAVVAWVCVAFRQRGLLSKSFATSVGVCTS
jgi:hypothetical protein